MNKQYHIFNRLSRVQHGPLDFIGVVEILEKESDLANWYYWLAGNQDWTQVELETDIKNELQKRKTPAPPPPPPKLEPLTPPPPPPPQQMAQTNSDIGITIDNNLNTQISVEVLPVKSEETKIAEAPKSSVTEKTDKIILPETTEVSLEKETIVVASGIENRKNIRLNCSLRTIFTNKKKTFISTAVNISLGGIRVKHAIPMEILKGECEVYISGPQGNESLIFKCTPAQEGQFSDRFKFQSISDENISRLNKWLEKISQTVEK